MKKIVTTLALFFFTLSLMVLPTVINAASMDVSINVLGTASDGEADGGLFGNFFLVDDNIGQDLYMNIQKRVRSEGSDLAITRTAARRNLTKSELYAIIPGSNIGDILSKDPRGALSPQEVSKRRADIINDLASEKDLADLETKLQMEVKSTELFTNGNEYDSGFDLVTDLDVLQFFLFNKEPPQQISPGGDGSGDSRDVRDRGENAPPDAENPPGPFGDSNSGNRQLADTQTPPANPAIAAEASKRAGAVECVDDAGLNKAVEDARTSEQAAAFNLDGTPRPNGDGGAAGANDSGGDDQAADELKPESPADWKRKQTCSPTDVFCIIVEFKYKTESSYTAGNNCVACHIEKINDTFKKVLSHNLVPNKVTGNLLEGPKCKDALMGANWLTSNLIIIGQPILTPPNDDLVVKGDIFRNLLDATERYKPAGVCGLVSDCNFDPATHAIAQALPNTTFTDTTASITDEVLQLQNQKTREFQQQQIKVRAALEGQQYQVILSELSTMNAYFSNFTELFTSLVGDPKSSPCGVLANKKTCS